MQKIIPEAVTKNDKGYLLVNNDPIMLTMLNAIKEEQQEIQTLQKENAALTAHLRLIERKVGKRVTSRQRR